MIEKGADYWKQVARFGLHRKFLTPKEMEIMRIACEIPDKSLSEKQSKIVIEIEEKLKIEGLFLEGS